MKRLRSVSAVGLIVLQGCDNSNGSPAPPPTHAPSPAPTPTLTPTPTPTATPTPTPTPTPVAASFPLDGRERFPIAFYASAEAGNQTPNQQAGATAFPPTLVQVVSTSTTRSLNLAPFVAGSGDFIWSIGEASNVAFFNPPSTAFNGELELIGTERGGFGDRLILLNNFWPTDTIQEAAYKFRYVSYALWLQRSHFSSLPFRNDLHIFGYPSTSEQVPTTGTESYSSVVKLRILTVTNSGGYLDEGASATAVTAINYAAGAVVVQFTLSVVRNNTTVLLGTVRGTGVISSDRARFSGTLTSPDSSLSGQFAGSFFGPAGEEVGLVLGLNGPVSSAEPAAEQRIVGALIGK